MQDIPQSTLQKLQEALGVLFFFPILYKPELIDQNYAEHQTLKVRECAKRLMTMQTLTNEAGMPPDKVFVTDWAKDKRSRIVVQLAIGKVLRKANF